MRKGDPVYVTFVRIDLRSMERHRLADCTFEDGRMDDKRVLGARAGEGQWLEQTELLTSFSPMGLCPRINRGEGDIRKAIVEADLVDCMVSLPAQLFNTTQIAACLWFLARNKANGKFRDRRGQTLFIDARHLGRLTDRTSRDLSQDETAAIGRVYHAWRGERKPATSPWNR